MQYRKARKDTLWEKHLELRCKELRERERMYCKDRRKKHIKKLR